MQRDVFSYCRALICIVRKADGGLYLLCSDFWLLLTAAAIGPEDGGWTVLSVGVDRHAAIVEAGAELGGGGGGGVTESVSVGIDRQTLSSWK